MSRFKDLKLAEVTFVAFDTETSGAYPVGYEIVEFGAVKWRGDQVLGTMQFLLKPRVPMSDFIIGIHGITNEMVAGSGTMKDRIQEIDDFFSGAIPVAHHAPFDLGFLAYDFERFNLPLDLQEPALCTSLLSRGLISETVNHKLQTLVKHFKIDGGQAHRALDDAKACMWVAQECFRRLGEAATLQAAYSAQGKNLEWKNYSLNALKNTGFRELFTAIEKNKVVEFRYSGGSTPKETRPVRPMGLVRNPDGDYLQGYCLRSQSSRRFYLDKISEVQISDVF